MVDLWNLFGILFIIMNHMTIKATVYLLNLSMPIGNSVSSLWMIVCLLLISYSFHWCRLYFIDGNFMNLNVVFVVGKKTGQVAGLHPTSSTLKTPCFSSLDLKSLTIYQQLWSFCFFALFLVIISLCAFQINAPKE